MLFILFFTICPVFTSVKRFLMLCFYFSRGNIFLKYFLMYLRNTLRVYNTAKFIPAVQKCQAFDEISKSMRDFIDIIVYHVTIKCRYDLRFAIILVDYFGILTSQFLLDPPETITK